MMNFIIAFHLFKVECFTHAIHCFKLLSTGTRKVIFIINYNLPYPYPVSIIVPERFGVNRDSNIPVILVYDGSHYENLIPVSDTDQEKVIDLVGVYSEEISRPALQPPGM